LKAIGMNFKNSALRQSEANKAKPLDNIA